jgi:hypothetical protein
MSVCLYLAVDGDYDDVLPDFVELSAAMEDLSEAAEEEGVPDLLDFAELDELEDLLGEDDDEEEDLEEDDEDSYFDPGEALVTVRALLKHFATKDREELTEELILLERTLVKLQEEGLLFKFMQDY